MKISKNKLNAKLFKKLNSKFTKDLFKISIKVSQNIPPVEKYKNFTKMWLNKKDEKKTKKNFRKKFLTKAPKKNIKPKKKK